MPSSITVEQVQRWIDDDLIAGVEAVDDAHAEFNLLVQMSGMMIHIIQRQPDGPLLIGQQIEFDEEIRHRLSELSFKPRSQLLTQIRGRMIESEVVYGFRDQRDENVSFEDMHHIFLERRLYPNQVNQQRLMDSLIDIWKILRYIDDMWELIESVDDSSPTSAATEE